MENLDPDNVLYVFDTSSLEGYDGVTIYDGGDYEES